MQFFDNTVAQALIQWLAQGMSEASWWQIVLYTLFTTHITICAVTIYLHRAMSHPRFGSAPRCFALLPWLAVDRHRHENG
jgi:stearoyl-CoA desaturase (Delta-9 desaturase)